MQAAALVSSSISLTVPHMHHRIDVMLQLNLSVPNTWEELQVAVEAVEASGLGIRGICLDSPMPGAACWGGCRQEGGGREALSICVSSP